MSSKTYSLQTSDPTPYPLISTGEYAFYPSILRVDKLVNSDWVKLYLGKRDGTHVLGCTKILSMLKLATLNALQIQSSRNSWRACKARGWDSPSSTLTRMRMVSFVQTSSSVLFWYYPEHNLIVFWKANTGIILGNCWAQTLRRGHRQAPYLMHSVPWRADLVFWS